MGEAPRLAHREGNRGRPDAVDWTERRNPSGSSGGTPWG